MTENSWCVFFDTPCIYIDYICLHHYFPSSRTRGFDPRLGPMEFLKFFKMVSFLILLIGIDSTSSPEHEYI